MTTTREVRRREAVARIKAQIKPVIAEVDECSDDITQALIELSLEYYEYVRDTIDDMTE